MLPQKLTVVLSLILFVNTFAYTQGVSDEQISQLGLAPSQVSDKAKKLLKSDFYWSPIEESSPFGNDDGSDAFYFFRKWRMENTSESPVTFLNQLIDSWGYPEFDLTEMNENKIASFMQGSSGLTESQTDLMREQLKKMAKQAGKEFDEEQFQKLLSMTADSMGPTYLIGIDNTIIAVGFGQYLIEGEIGQDIAGLTKIALKRELMPVVLERWDESYQADRELILKQMLVELEKM